MARSGWSSSNYIRCASGLITAAPLTIACWMKTASIPSSMTVAGVFSSGSAGNRHRFSLDIDSTAKVDAACSDGSTTNDALSSTTISTGTWFHGCVVFASSTSRSAYLNGGSKGTNTTARTPTAANINRTSIGGGDGSSFTAAFNGEVAEVGYWNAALDDAEVASLAAGVPPSSVRPQSLIAYLPLIRELVDLKGNGFAITGSLSVTGHPRIYGLAA